MRAIKTYSCDIMALVPANQPQLIRSSQKDEYYQTSLRNNANEAFQSLAGSRRWLQWRKEVELLSDLAYYALTTLSGYQTLGEEYVSIIQVDPTKRRIPSRMRRLAFVLFHTFAPYVLDKLLVCIEHELEVDEWNSPNTQRNSGLTWNPMLYVKAWVQRVLRRLNREQRKSLKPVVVAVQQGIAVLHRVHVALFYISGAFYHLAKRTSAISYLRVQGMPGDDKGIRTSYRLLGCVSLLQLAITLALQFNNLRQKQRARHEWTQHRKLPVSAYLHLSRLFSTCSLLSPQITISSANIIVHGDSCLTSSVNLSISTANRKGLKANP